MKLQTAKNKIKKAENAQRYAINKGLKHHNFQLNAYNNCLNSIESGEDYEKLMK